MPEAKRKIWGVVPIGGDGTRLGLPFSKFFLPQKGFDHYVPVIDCVVSKMERAGADHIVFVHGIFENDMVTRYYGTRKFIHIKQRVIGFARCLLDFLRQIKPNADDAVLFGLPDAIFRGNPFPEMLSVPSVACGIFITNDNALRVDRLSQNGKTFQVKSILGNNATYKFWGCLKFDVEDLRIMDVYGWFDEIDEIGILLNRCDRKTMVMDGHWTEYQDLGTWNALNVYWGKSPNPE